MKQTGLTLAGVIIAVIGLHAFRAYQTTVVTGHVPVDPTGLLIIARQGADSTSTVVDETGNFRLELNKGTWELDVLRKFERQSTQYLFSDTMNISHTGTIELGNILSTASN